MDTNSKELHIKWIKSIVDKILNKQKFEHYHEKVYTYYKPYLLMKKEINLNDSISLSNETNNKYSKDTYIGFKMYNTIYYYDKTWKNIRDKKIDNYKLNNKYIIGEITNKTQKNNTMVFKIKKI